MRSRLMKRLLVLSLVFVMAWQMCPADSVEAATAGWRKEKDGWHYANKDGKDITHAWKLIQGKWYLFDYSGVMMQDLCWWSGSWYYFGSDGAMRTGWQTINGKRCYFLSDGSLRDPWKNEWVKFGNSWIYTDDQGAPVRNWQWINGKWYYFGLFGGGMQTGWLKEGGKWYYMDPINGYMKTGWQKISGKWYYFYEDGPMATGLQMIGGKYYYFDPNTGAMVTGKKTINGYSLVFDSNGVLQTKLTAAMKISLLTTLPGLGGGDVNAPNQQIDDGYWHDDPETDTQNFSSAKVGDIITFGHYEQDNNTANGKEAIEWLVLDKKSNGSLLVVSRYILDCMEFNTMPGYITWEDSTLRSWLNNGFYNNAFTNDERKQIQLSSLTTGKNQYWKSEGGNKTNDYVFCLSMDEVLKYFQFDAWYTEDHPYEGKGSLLDENGNYQTINVKKYDEGYSRELIAAATPYAKNKGVYTHTMTAGLIEDYYEKYNRNVIGSTGGIYWLRTMGWQNSYACCVYTGGDAGWRDIENEVEKKNGVRPAMWITAK